MRFIKSIIPLFIFLLLQLVYLFLISADFVPNTLARWSWPEWDMSESDDSRMSYWLKNRSNRFSPVRLTIVTKPVHLTCFIEKIIFKRTCRFGIGFMLLIALVGQKNMRNQKTKNNIKKLQRFSDFKQTKVTLTH